MAFQPAIIEVDADLEVSTDPPVVAPPAEDLVEPFLRDSWHYDAPEFDATDGWSHPEQVKTLLQSNVWGRYRIVIAGSDRTFYRNRQAIVLRWSHGTPFGPLSASILWAQLTPFEEPPGWLADGQRIKIQRVKNDGTIDHGWHWCGFVDTSNPAWSADGWAVITECKGYLLYQGEDSNNRPTRPAGGQFAHDIGKRIPHRMNEIVGRRFHRIPKVETGIEQWKKGPLTDSVIDFVSELLSIGWTTAGVCWSLLDRAAQPFQARMVLPDPDTVDYTLALGTEGVTWDLREANDERPNVIYGEWITPEGYRTQNLKYPKLLADPPPPFPLVGSSFTPGGGDSGFRPFARWLERNGYKIYSDTTYDARDENEVRDAQDRMGVAVDGEVNATTWGTAFVEADGSFEDAIYLPIAWDKRVEPYLYTPDGVKIGKNPDYDPKIPRREAFINFGENVHRADVHQAAKQMVERSKELSLVGTVTTHADPEECHRREMRAGKTLTVPYLWGTGGGGVKFHVAEVDVDEEEDGAVQLLVDTLWRDAFTVRQIHERNHEARHNPGRLRRQNASSLTQDTQPVFDLDNGAGNLYPFQLDAETWRVVPFAAGAWGTFIRIRATTDTATEFAMMLLAHKVSSRFCQRNVGDPLAVKHPYKENAATLKDAGLIQAWGSKDQPCGYSKAGAADGYKSDDDELTGRFEWDSAVEWWSERVPRLYVAVWAADATEMDLRFWNQPVEF